MKKSELRQLIREEIKFLKENPKYKWTSAEKLKVGDKIYNTDTGEINTIIKTKPFYNGFKELIGATITWDDDSTRVERGDFALII